MNEDDAFDADRDLPPHKRAGYAERMYEAADLARKAKREQDILDAMAIEWAISTGAPK